MTVRKCRIQHVLAAGGVRAKRALPGVTAIEEKNFIVAALRANALDHGRKPVEPTNAAIGSGQSFEILIGQRVGRRAVVRNAEVLEKILAGDVRRLSARITHANVDRRLAVIDRCELPMSRTCPVRQHGARGRPR